MTGTRLIEYIINTGTWPVHDTVHDRYMTRYMINNTIIPIILNTYLIDYSKLEILRMSPYLFVKLFFLESKIKTGPGNKNVPALPIVCRGSVFSNQNDMKKKRPIRVHLSGCPTEKTISTVYYPDSMSVRLNDELVPLTVLEHFGQTVTRNRK